MDVILASMAPHPFQANICIGSFDTPIVPSFIVPFNIPNRGLLAHRTIHEIGGRNRSAPLVLLRKRSRVLLSLTSASPTQKRKGRRLQYRAEPDAIPISTVTPGQQFFGKVCDVGPANSAWIDINVATSSGKSVRARLRLPMKDGLAVLSEKPGSIIPVYARKVNASAGRLEVCKGHPPAPPPEYDPQIHRLVKSVTVSEHLKGRVLAVGPYGAVIDVGVFRTTHRGKLCLLPALLQRKQFPVTWATSGDLVRRSDVTRVLSPGDEIAVWVRSVHPQSARFFVDVQPVDPAALQEKSNEKVRRRRQARRRRSWDSVETGEQLRGTVREMAPFGVFIDAGLNRDVLLHFSEMGGLSSTWQDDLPVGTQLIVETRSKGAQGVKVGLLFVLQYELQRARERAASPLATSEDLDKLQFFEAQDKAFSRRRGTSAKALDVSNERIEDLETTNKGREHRNDVSHQTSLDESPEAEGEHEAVGDDEESEHTDDNDNEAGSGNSDIFFSDEYLEDKYNI